jgi:putative FmdB family regulatory protein
MPIYEYRCKKCGTVTERERPMADRKKRTKCTACGSYATELLIGSPEVMLVGTCWAKDGYEETKVKK